MHIYDLQNLQLNVSAQSLLDNKTNIDKNIDFMSIETCGERRDC